VSFVKAPATLKSIAFPYAGPNGAIVDEPNFHDGSVSGRNNNNKNKDGKNKDNSQQQPQQQGEEKSFWDKYGTYIIIFFAIQTLSGLFGPKQGEAAGGKGGAAAAAGGEKK
jgi:hypothetical protein